MGKKGPLWWRESDWLLRGSSAAIQILLRHSGPILSNVHIFPKTFLQSVASAIFQPHNTPNKIFFCTITNWLLFIDTAANTSRKVTNYVVKQSFIWFAWNSSPIIHYHKNIYIKYYSWNLTTGSFQNCVKLKSFFSSFEIFLVRFGP